MKIIKWSLILFLVIAAATAVYISVKLGQPATTVSAPQDFEIKKGERAGEVAFNLKENGLISSGTLFDLYLRLKDAEDKLQAGVYVLDSNMTIPEIVQILTQGKVKASGQRITVIEGWNIRDIAARLENLGLMQAEEFTEAVGLPRTLDNQIPDFSGEFEFLKVKPGGAPLEGFLFPDTYIFKEDDNAEAVARRMLKNFDEKVDMEIRSEINRQGRDLYEVLALASLVEREVGRNVRLGAVLSDEELRRIREERRLVAGVFANRLELGMALESDATISYITGKNEPRSALADLDIESPYNTYRNTGLPPTPIANPSLDSVKAAVNPADTDYLYFLTEPDGTAHFARTFEEHQQNRFRYLE